MWGRTWIFDLDNTLHNATPHIFPHINRAMTAYLQAHLGLDEAGAGELRRHYSRAVQKALAIADLFDDVFTIERTRYRPKPGSHGFLRIGRANHLKPQRCIMLAYLQ